MAEARAKVAPTSIIGVPGLSIWSGIVSEEYLSSLRGTKGQKTYREMADDAVIAAMLNCLTMPLLAVDFNVVPASKEQADAAASEFVQSCLDDMGEGLDKHIEDALGMLTYGWAISEVVLKKREGLQGKVPSVFADGRLGIDVLDGRAQDTLYKWKLDDYGNLTSFYQSHPTTGKIIEIPSSKLLHFTFGNRKKNPEGRSALRPLYRPWRFRNNLEVLEGIGIERDMAGLPVFKPAFGATDTDIDKAESIGRSLRNDEEAHIVLPPPRTATDKGWEVNLLNSAAKSYNVRETIRDYNKQMLMVYFAQFLALGMEQVGTQALVKGSQDFFSLALRAIMNSILEVWNRQLLPMLFRYNSFPGIAGYPKIDASMPGKPDMAGIASFLQQLTGVNIITPGKDIEDYVRALAGLPERPEGVGEGVRAPVTPVSGLPKAFDYDPSQHPRDEGGRWVDTGGGGGGGNEKPSGGLRDLASQGNLSRAESESYVLENFESNYTDENRQFALKYNDEGDKLNQQLRKGEENTATIQEIDIAISKNVTPDTLILWRGTREKVLGNTEIGTTFSDKGFTSLTFDKSMAQGYAGEWNDGAMLRVTIPKGTPALPMDIISKAGRGESQLVLPRNTKFVFTGKQQKGGRVYFDMEVIK